MRRASTLSVLLGLAFVLGAFAPAQPPRGKGEKGKDGPPPFRLGKVLPPFVAEELELTEDQEEHIAALEKEVKAKLEKILTPKQKARLRDLRPGPGKGPKEKEKDDPDGGRVAAPGAGIQWFATLEGGRAEARRTNRPILLVSAAPHCSGVSGIW